MRIICIGHKPPAFQPGLPYAFITPRPIEGHKSIVIPDDHLGQTFDGKVLSEYTQLFTLADRLEADRIEEPIYLFQYRKFIGVRAPTQRSSNLPFAFVVSPVEAASYFPRRDELADLVDSRLVGPTYEVQMADQYCAQHSPRDLIAFSLALSELEEFDRERVKRFIGCPVLIPSPGMGLYQPASFVSHMQLLRRAWRVYYENYYVPREGYQRRVGGFLLERLHSFLVFEEQHAPRQQLMFEGHHVIVSATPNVGGTI